MIAFGPSPSVDVVAGVEAHPSRASALARPRDYFPRHRVTKPPADAPTMLDAVRTWVGYWDGDDE